MIKHATLGAEEETTMMHPHARRPVNPCSYKGLHIPHDWQAVGGGYEYHCRGMDELDVGVTARQAELIAEREMLQAGMPVVNVQEEAE